MADITLLCGHSNYDACSCGEPPEGDVFKIISTDTRGKLSDILIADGLSYQHAIDRASAINRANSKSTPHRHCEVVHIDRPLAVYHKTRP